MYKNVHNAYSANVLHRGIHYTIISGERARLNTMTAGAYCTCRVWIVIFDAAVNTLPWCFSIRHHFCYHFLPIIRWHNHLLLLGVVTSCLVK